MLEKNSKARQKKEFEEIPYKYGGAFYKLPEGVNSAK